MENINENLNSQLFLLQEILWNSVLNIILAIIVFILFIIIVKILLNILNKYGENNKISNKPWINFLIKQLQKIPFWIFIMIWIYIAFRFLNISELLQNILNWILLLILIILVVKISSKCLNFSLEKVLSKDKTAKKTIETIINVILRWLWIFIFLMNIWVNLTPLITWLWIAWIAVAFALQNILTDLFSSFSILLSKPFIVWDYVKVWEWSNEKVWTVKQISLKSTTLTTVQWYDVIVPNSSILSTEIINYRTMNHRRQRINIWVTYNTWYDKLKNIPQIIEKNISSQKNVKFERCYLEKMWNSSIDFLISYDILDSDYQQSLIINEKIYLELVKSFEKEWIEFAFPSQTIYLQK